jgi:hypothetical protein
MAHGRMHGAVNPAQATSLVQYFGMQIASSVHASNEANHALIQLINAHMKDSY